MFAPSSKNGNLLDHQFSGLVDLLHPDYSIPSFPIHALQQVQVSLHEDEEELKD